MDTSANLLNSMTLEQRKAAANSDFGRVMVDWAASYVTRFWWVRTMAGEPPDLHNGTAFFLGIEDEVIVVTAAHVYRGYLADRAKPRKAMTCWVGDVVFDPEERLLDVNDAIDIATFRFTYEELRKVHKQAILIDPADWPPEHPASGQAAFLLGFPGSTRIWRSPTEIDFSLYVGNPRISSASHRQITCPFEREVWGTLAGMPLPPVGLNLGGISGGPLLIPKGRPDGAWDMTLGGVIFEAPSDGNSFETVICAPAHFIRADGRIDPNSFPVRFVQLDPPPDGTMT